MLNIHKCLLRVLISHKRVTHRSFLSRYIQLCHPIVFRDAAALTQFWDWLETEITKDRILTEVEVSDKLLEFRSKQDGFLDTSFDTISGTVIDRHFFFDM